ncbi:MAG: transporter [Flavobacteriaceae bacterium]|jgi:hypothetical protein|nr:transporter [Flavobacteriaceae bacterium]
MDKSLFLLPVILFSEVIFSQDIITDRPDQTESAVVVGEKKIQIESGILNQENSGGEKKLSIPTNLFRYGISEKIELRLNLEHSDKKNYGIESIEIGSKINFNKNQNSLTKIALLSHLLLPKKEENLGIMNLISISHDQIKNLSIGYNLGYTHFMNQYGFLKYSIAFGSGLSEKIGFFIETYGEIEKSEIPISNFDSGFTYLVKDNLQIDVSFGLGINNQMNFQSIGISWKSKKNDAQIKKSKI